MHLGTTRQGQAIRPIVAGLMLTMFLVALDGTIVSTAMPNIVGSLGGFALYAWVPSVYLLVTAVSTPLYGKLADLYGRKRILFVGVGLFLLGSMLSGAAPNMVGLIAFRAIQGLGAGAVQPVTMTIIGDIFTLEQRARMQGYFSSVWGISSVIGPLVGGFLVDDVGWRWIFYLNLPFGLLAVLMIGTFFHEQQVTRRHRLDLSGATYLTFTLTALLLFLIEGGQSWPWLSLQSAGLMAIALVSLVLLIQREHVAAEPVVPLDLFRHRIIAVSGLGAFFAGMVMINASYEIPLFVQGVMGQDAIHAGLVLAPLSLGWPLASSQSGRLAIRYGYRVTATLGMALVTTGTALLLTLGPHTPFPVIGAFGFVMGAGMGLSSTPMIIAVQGAVAWARRGIATSTQMFVRSFGQVVGLAMMGAIVNNATAGHQGSAANRAINVHTRASVPPAVLHQIQLDLTNAVHHAFLAALVAALIGLMVVTRLPGGSAAEHQVQEEAEQREPAVPA